MQKHYSAADFQLSLFQPLLPARLPARPDGRFDVQRHLHRGPTGKSRHGVQGDGSWKVAANHTLRGGFLAQRERATTQTNAQVLPVDATGALIHRRAPGVLFGLDEIGWLYGVYLQDEWKVSPTVTLNFGGRFSAYNYSIYEYQFSPRINAVWQPNDG